MKRILIAFIFALAVVCLYRRNVLAITGSGTSTNPYIVTKESELVTALGSGSTSAWKYIALTDTVAITKTINVKKGKFRIFAKGANRILRRSQNMEASVNSESTARKCIKIAEDVEMSFGYPASNYKLILDGSKSYIPEDREVSDFISVENYAELTIDTNCLFRNAKNTKSDDESAPIRSYGTLNINGEIANCYGNNGGAIKSIGGDININSTCKIHDCESGTEGGAIYARSGSTVIMRGGSVYDNKAMEEGGGLFITYSTCLLYDGSIKNNSAGATGGGVFSGYTSKLQVGLAGVGPIISDNFSIQAGGGVRCNGGTGDSGGTSEFYGGTISNNVSSSSGGGISVGLPSNVCESRVKISEMTIAKNHAQYTGGGISFSNGVKGIGENTVRVLNSIIEENNAMTDGGGMLVNTNVAVGGTAIRTNKAKNGGGLFIASNGKLSMSSGVIVKNVADMGAGIFQNGIFELSSSGYVNSNNEVYLPRDKHIDITGKLSVSSNLASLINSEVKTNGTILVDVTYEGGSADSELYLTGNSNLETVGSEVKKKFETVDNLFLRPSTKITSINSSRYIVISQKYSVDYDANSLDSVANMPQDEVAFWNEMYCISSNVVNRDGFVLDIEKHWNLSKDGTGNVMKPGLDTILNKDIVLYAIWTEIPITDLRMEPIDRYYAVGQKITLNAKELTRKVKVENNIGTNVTYEVTITEIRNAGGVTIAKGKNIPTEQFMTTEQGAKFTLLLKASNYAGDVTCTGMMNVYIIDDLEENCELRFVSKEFVDSINPKSKWNRRLRGQLEQVVNNETDYIYEVEISNENLKKIKQNVKNNSYIIDNNLNDSVGKTYVIE